MLHSTAMDDNRIRDQIQDKWHNQIEAMIVITLGAGNYRIHCPKAPTQKESDRRENL